MATRSKKQPELVEIDEEEPEEAQQSDEPLPQDVYYVERVVDKKVQDSELRYFVKWSGYHENENTWETMDNLDNSQEALIRFEDKLAKTRKKGGRTFPPPSKNIDDAYCRRERARVVKEHELIEVMCFFPDTCRFVVKYDDNSCVLLQPAEYAALPFEKKAMFAEFLAKTHGYCNQRIMNNLKKMDDLGTQPDGGENPEEEGEDDGESVIDVPMAGTSRGNGSGGAGNAITIDDDDSDDD